MHTFAVIVPAILVALAPIVESSPTREPSVSTTRPLLVTVDDLPIASGRLHPDPEERSRITRDLLASLARHRIHAVGLVTWSNVGAPSDLDLLELWLKAGHELGSHSYNHLDYTRTSIDAYREDVEKGRAALVAFLSARGRSPRFFRFPFLDEGDTPEKLEAMRAWLAEKNLRNLPVTLDNQDWSFEQRWVEARKAGDEAAVAEIAADYQAALRIAVKHHERRGDAMAGRPLPQILLLHANEVGAAQWDALFQWLKRQGHVFAGVDDVLGDPIFAEPQAYVGPHGFGLWDRLRAQRADGEARKEVEDLLLRQVGAWNRGDIESFCSIYADDATFLAPSGIVRGRQAVIERYRAKYPGREGMGTLSLEFLEFRPVAGTEFSLLGDAVPGSVHGLSVAARWRLEWPDRPEATGLTLIVLRRRGDSWEIVQDASM